MSISYRDIYIYIYIEVTYGLNARGGNHLRSRYILFLRCRACAKCVVLPTRFSRSIECERIQNCADESCWVWCSISDCRGTFESISRTRFSRQSMTAYIRGCTCDSPSSNWYDLWPWQMLARLSSSFSIADGEYSMWMSALSFRGRDGICWASVLLLLCFLRYSGQW